MGRFSQNYATTISEIKTLQALPLRSLRPLGEEKVSGCASTITKQGLKVQAELDTASYQTGRTISTKELAQLNPTRHSFHGEWNYKLTPNQ